MSSRVTPLLVWDEDDEGESAGAYTIRLEAQHRWRLMRHSRTAGVFPTRTAARQAAAGLHRRRGLRQQLVRYLVVAGVAFVVLGVALARRSEPNPDYLPARALADRIDQARLAVEAGEINVNQIDQMFDGLEGGSFEHGGLLKLGITGVFDGDCYGMVWRPGFLPSGVVIRRDYVSCESNPSLIDQPDPPGLVAEPMVPTWAFALPDSERTPVWFIPVFAIFSGLFVGVFARATGLLFALRR